VVLADGFSHERSEILLEGLLVAHGLGLVHDGEHLVDRFIGVIGWSICEGGQI